MAEVQGCLGRVETGLVSQAARRALTDKTAIGNFPV